MSLLISDRLQDSTTKDKEGHYVMIKEIRLSGDRTIMNVQVYNSRLKIHQAKTDRSKVRNRQTLNHNWRFLGNTKKHTF